MGYQLLLILWIQVNHKFKCKTKCIFFIGLYVDFYNHQKNYPQNYQISSSESKKIGTHKKWITICISKFMQQRDNREITFGTVNKYCDVLLMNAEITTELTARQVS